MKRRAGVELKIHSLFNKEPGNEYRLIHSELNEFFEVFSQGYRCILSHNLVSYEITKYWYKLQAWLFPVSIIPRKLYLEQ